MKYLKSFPIYIIILLFVGRIVPIKALDIGVNLAQLTSPTGTPAPAEATPTSQPSQTPSGQPSPTAAVSTSPQPSQAPSPTDKPVLSVTAGVSVTVSPTAVLSPTKVASPSLSPTQKPSENAGGTDVVIPSPTPEPSSPAETPTVTPSPTTAPLPVEIGNTDPPVKKAAEQIFKNVVVPPLSFLLQRPQEDFYKENQITKPTSYGLMAFAAFGMISGVYLLFPTQIQEFYKRGKNKLMGLFTTNSNNLSVID